MWADLGCSGGEDLDLPDRRSSSAGAADGPVDPGRGEATTSAAGSGRPGAAMPRGEEPEEAPGAQAASAASEGDGSLPSGLNSDSN